MALYFLLYICATKDLQGTASKAVSIGSEDLDHLLGCNGRADMTATRDEFLEFLPGQ